MGFTWETGERLCLSVTATTLGLWPLTIHALKAMS